MVTQAQLGMVVEDINRIFNILIFSGALVLHNLDVCNEQFDCGILPLSSKWQILPEANARVKHYFEEPFSSSVRQPVIKLTFPRLHASVAGLNLLYNSPDLGEQCVNPLFWH